jgi:hypothetical protein
MAEKRDVKLNILLLFILIVKVLWIISLFSHFIIKHYLSDDNYYVELNVNIEYMLHNFFTILIGSLLIYLYHHLTSKVVCIEGHIKLYLFSFGVLSIIGVLQKMFNKYYFTEYGKVSEEVEYDLGNK